MAWHGSGDVPALTRANAYLVADADRAQYGRGDEIRRCLFTNYCEGLDQAHKAVTCQTWDRLRLPDDAQAARVDGRRLLAPPWNPGEPPSV